MSTTVMFDVMVMPAANTSTEATEVTSAKCDCCGLIEECTPAYINTIRKRYHGNWICGLCGEAVKDEITRSQRQITTEEAMTRHMNFCRKSRSTEPPENTAVHLIAAMSKILKRSLDSPIRSLPNSPVRHAKNIRLSRSFTDLQESMK